MRVIAGRYKSLTLHSFNLPGTRPTTDRIKEAWASSLTSILTARNSGGANSMAKAHVLDAFAGSGALGIELISRGAASCFFVEKDWRAVKLLKKNVALLHDRGGKVGNEGSGAQSGRNDHSDRGSNERCSHSLQTMVCASDVCNISWEDYTVGKTAGFFPLDILIFDPPYDLPSKTLSALLNKINTLQCLSDFAVLSYEHRRNENKTLDDAFAWHYLYGKNYGDIRIDYYNYESV
ncbi:MAG: RsmD family RNA methyltransferase [Coriobacteriales bacterium]|jgi:16S rRNA (guanine966-N2)-methyltransferase|nr:RsmD family RNA methyltransferase [Coriobacteriales bacterium]